MNQADVIIKQEKISEQKPSQLAEFWARFSKNRGAVIGLSILLFLVFIAFFGSLSCSV